MNQNHSDERRQFSRIDFHHEMILFNVANSSRYNGTFNDISLKGMLFHSTPLPKSGEQLEGRLLLGDIELVIRGVVLWSKEGRGTAVKFQDMDLESFSHLRRLITLNMGDSERIDQELFASL